MGAGKDREENKVTGRGVGTKGGSDQSRLLAEVLVIDDRQLLTRSADVAHFHSQLVGQGLLDGGADLARIRCIRVCGINAVNGERLGGDAEEAVGIGVGAELCRLARGREHIVAYSARARVPRCTATRRRSRKTCRRARWDRTAWWVGAQVGP